MQIKKNQNVSGLEIENGFEIDTANNLGRTSLFFRQWLMNPLDVASIIPSSKFTAKLIASEISSETGPVLELGPGTGIFTQQILKNGVSPKDLVLIEKNTSFANYLKNSFTGVNIVNDEAGIFCKEDFGLDRPFGAVVFALSALTLPQEALKNILKSCLENMDDNAAIYQVTYSWRPTFPQALLDEFNLTHERLGFTLLNIPPAYIYKYQKAKK